MKKFEKEQVLHCFLSENNGAYDIASLASKGFGMRIYYIESKTSLKSIFVAETKEIFLNRLTTTVEDSTFLVGYHIAEYVLHDVQDISLIYLDNMDADVYQLAQKIYQKSVNVKTKQLRKGR